MVFWLRLGELEREWKKLQLITQELYSEDLNEIIFSKITDFFNVFVTKNLASN